MMSADHDFRWCTAPDCKSGQMHTEGYIFRCIECGIKWCTTCNVAWHEDETCQVYRARKKAEAIEEAQMRRIEEAKRKAEEASEAFVKESAKSCPGCQRKVQKIEYVRLGHRRYLAYANHR